MNEIIDFHCKKIVEKNSQQSKAIVNCYLLKALSQGK